MDCEESYNHITKQFHSSRKQNYILAGKMENVEAKEQGILLPQVGTIIAHHSCSPEVLIASQKLRLDPASGSGGDDRLV